MQLKFCMMILHLLLPQPSSAELININDTKHHSAILNKMDDHNQTDSIPLRLFSFYFQDARLLQVIMYNKNILQDSLLTKLHQQLQIPIVVSDIKGLLESYTLESSLGGREPTPNFSEMKVAYLLIFDKPQSVLKYWNGIQKTQIYWNTRANFLIIIMNDSSNVLKKKESILLKKLWKTYKILNVLILEITNQQYKVILYEPFIRRNTTNTGRTTTLHPDNPKLKSLTTNKLKNMNNYTLRFSIFERQPSFGHAPDNVSSSADYGFDGYVLEELERYMHITVDTSLPNHVQDYGFRYSNGTSTGSLGEVLQNRADIAFNTRFIKNYGTNDIAFTKPLYSDAICVVVPKAHQKSKWLAMATTFDNHVYIMIIVLYFTFSILWYLFKYLKSSKSIDVVSIFLDMFHPFVNMTITNLPKFPSERILVICSLLLGMILVNIFQGKLVTAIGRPSYLEDIQTLEALDESGYRISTGSWDMGDTFDESDSPVRERLKTKVTVVNGDAGLERVASRGDVAALVRKSEADIRRFLFRRPDGSKRLHLVRECPRTYLLSYVLHKTSPYLDKVNVFMGRIFESGITLEWMENSERDMIEKYNISRSKIFNKGTPVNIRRVFTVNDLLLPFYLLVFGLSVAVLVFTVEAVTCWLNQGLTIP